MITFLKTVLIILLVYFGLKFLIRLLTPYIMRYIAKKAGQRFEQAFGNNPFDAQEKKKDGSITIDKMPSSRNKSKSTVGEYVDYEEID
ncbi:MULTISPECIES: DUF4834 family protein [Altibacter]|uniref:DUF4834 family protein n=1 Tax=Altibacter TaxID=1535231 RepID=UPI0005563EB4|nr:MULTISPECIES: DUF4834 family protein [Altibacter]MCW8980915.1 DUF4834 family protein [Altibacter sp.]MCW9038030.1 DUF4834 family protein [Altibacter sp.]